MTSPLTKYQRQPKQSIDLPSKGKWYSQGSVDKVEDLEVYSMTASNEIATKTPDTLLSGNTTVSIIKSCVPSIKDPWQIPIIDIYTILSVIRMASYGGNINAKNTCTECSEENSYEVDIQNILSHFAKGIFEDSLVIENMKFHLRPLTFKELNEINKQNFRHQRELLQTIPGITDETLRGEASQKVYSALSELRKNTVISSIAKIEVDNEQEDNLLEIAKFIENADKEFFVKVEQAVMRNNEQFIVPETDITCANCGHTSKLNIDLDYSNFFVQG